MRLLVLLAAIGCSVFSGGEETTMGRSSYLQSYAVPLSGNVPPVKPSRYNDEFAAQRPATVADPAFVSLASKWTTWDHGSALDNEPRINPRQQVMQLIGRGNKQWCGTYEELPLPTEGNPVAYLLYVRAMNSYIGGNGTEDYPDLYYGLTLGEDLSDPDFTFQGIYGRIQRTGDSISGDTVAAGWFTWDAPLPAEGGVLAAGWPAQYLRAEVSSSVLASVYDTTITFAASMDGIGYQDVFRYDDLPFPVRHAGLGQRSIDGRNLQTIFDSIRLFELDATLNFDTYARLQQLGSV